MWDVCSVVRPSRVDSTGPQGTRPRVARSMDGQLRMVLLLLSCWWVQLDVCGADSPGEPKLTGSSGNRWRKPTPA